MTQKFDKKEKSILKLEALFQNIVLPKPVKNLGGFGNVKGFEDTFIKGVKGFGN